MTAIMVVEDEEKISTVLCMKLKTKGYEVVAFFNGADAWKGLQQQKPEPGPS